MSLGTENNRFRYFLFIGRSQNPTDAYLQIEITPESGVGYQGGAALSLDYREYC